MIAKVAVILCLFGLSHAGNLYGGSGFGHGTSLGYSSGYGYGSYGTGSSHGLGLGYASSLGYGSHGYSGYGGAYSRPAISTVSQYSIHTAPVVKTYSAGYSPYSSSYGSHAAYTPAISYGNHGYGGFGYGGYGHGSYGGYGSKYAW